MCCNVFGKAWAMPDLQKTISGFGFGIRVALGFGATPNNEGVLTVSLCGFGAASPSQDAALPAWGLDVFVVEESLQLQLHLLLLLLHFLSVCGLEPTWIEPPLDGMVNYEGNNVFRLHCLLVFLCFICWFMCVGLLCFIHFYVL